MRVFAVVLLGLRVIIGTDLPHLYQMNVDASVLVSSNEQLTRSGSADFGHRSSTCNGYGSISGPGNQQALALLRLAAGCGNAGIERMMSIPSPAKEHCSVLHQVWQMAWFQEKQASQLHLETRMVADSSLRRSVVRRQ